MKNKLLSTLLFVSLMLLCGCESRDGYPSIDSSILSINDAQFAIIKSKTEEMCNEYIETEYPKVRLVEKGRKVFISIDEFNKNNGRALFRFSFKANGNHKGDENNGYVAWCSGNATAVISGENIVVSIIPHSHGFSGN